MVISDGLVHSHLSVGLLFLLILFLQECGSGNRLRRNEGNNVIKTLERGRITYDKTKNICKRSNNSLDDRLYTLRLLCHVIARRIILTHTNVVSFCERGFCACSCDIYQFYFSYYRSNNSRSDGLDFNLLLSSSIQQMGKITWTSLTEKYS